MTDGTYEIHYIINMVLDGCNGVELRMDKDAALQDASTSLTDPKFKYLVKWRDLPIRHCEWRSTEDVPLPCIEEWENTSHAEKQATFNTFQATMARDSAKQLRMTRDAIREKRRVPICHLTKKKIQSKCPAEQIYRIYKNGERLFNLDPIGHNIIRSRGINKTRIKGSVKSESSELIYACEFSYDKMRGTPQEWFCGCTFYLKNKAFLCKHLVCLLLDRIPPE